MTTSGLCGTHRVHGGCGVLTTHTSHVCAQRLPGVGADRERWGFPAAFDHCRRHSCTSRRGEHIPQRARALVENCHVCARLPGVGQAGNGGAFQPRLITTVVTSASHAEGEHISQRARALCRLRRPLSD